MKRQEKSDVLVDEGRSKGSPCLDKHVLLFPPASESTSAIGNIPFLVQTGNTHLSSHIRNLLVTFKLEGNYFSLIVFFFNNDLSICYQR